MTSIFVSCPDHVLVDILCEWLKVHDVARLDSAMCDTHTRPRFVRLAYDSNIVYQNQHQVLGFTYKSMWCALSNATKWALLKGAYISCWDMSALDPVPWGSKPDESLRALGALVTTLGWDEFSNRRETLQQQKARFRRLALYCKNTTNLIVDGWLDPDFCVQLFKGLRNLQVVKLKYMDDAMLALVGDHCLQLRSIATNDACGRSELSVSCIAWRTFIQKRGALLESLCGIRHSNGDIDDLCSAIGRFCPRLRSLTDSSFSTNVEAFREMVAGCPQLTEVELVKCVTEEMLAVLSQLRRSLTSLRISTNCSISDEAVAAFVRRCPNLRKLYMPDGVVDVCTQALAALSQTCPHLQELKVAGRYWEKAHLQLLTSGCTQIRTLHLATIRGLLNLAQCCPLLENLLIINGDRVTDAELIALPQYCPHLVGLRLVHAHYVTMEGVQAVVQGCRRLRRLVLPICEDPGHYSYLRCPFSERFNFG